MAIRFGIRASACLAVWFLSPGGGTCSGSAAGTADLTALIADRLMPLSAAAGAQVVDGPEGMALEPHAAGPAASVEAPAEMWGPAGTISLHFRVSRPVFPDDPKTAVPLTILATPVIRAELVRDRQKIVLRVNATTAEGKPVPGQAFLSHLKSNRWYHLALRWDAAAGLLEAYLNGVRQQQLRRGVPDIPWRPAPASSGRASFGGAGEWDGALVRVAVGSIRAERRLLRESAVEQLAGSVRGELDGEGRTIYAGLAELGGWRPELAYEADFSRPLALVREADLFTGDRRTRKPDGVDWVLEGQGRAWTEDGQLYLESVRSGAGVVLWNTRIFPADFLLEFDFSPHDSELGLAIVFFCATAHARPDESVFALDLPRRAGVFPKYNSDALDCYHISYFATDPEPRSARRSSNLRKNRGFILVAAGDDNIVSAGPGPHRVRVIKMGGRIAVETRGRTIARYSDDARFGRVLGDGAIGLRLMAHSTLATYRLFRVHRLVQAGESVRR